MKFEESIFIKQPVEAVFACVTDYTTHPKKADAVRVDILAEPLFARQARKTMQTSLKKLKALLETEETVKFIT